MAGRGGFVGLEDGVDRDSYAGMRVLMFDVSEASTRGDLYIQFLVPFAHECFQFGFRWLDFPARKLPLTGVMGVLSLLQQKLPILSLPYSGDDM